MSTKPGELQFDNRLWTWLCAWLRRILAGAMTVSRVLANLGFHISNTTVGNILKAHSIEPAPERESRTAWRTFLAAHWDSIAAADFTTVEVWTRSGLVTFYVLVVMHLKTRRIEIAGATPHPNSEWMQQVGRNLTDCVDGFFRSSTHVILDRDTKHLPLRQIEVTPLLWTVYGFRIKPHLSASIHS